MCYLFPADPLSISFSPAISFLRAGENVSFNCFVTLPGTVRNDGLNFQWEGPGGTVTPADSIVSGQVVSSTLTLSNVNASQSGEYSCTASLEGSNVSRSGNITIVKSECLKGPPCLLSYYSNSIYIFTLNTLLLCTLLALCCDNLVICSVEAHECVQDLLTESLFRDI